MAQDAAPISSDVKEKRVAGVSALGATRRTSYRAQGVDGSVDCAYLLTELRGNARFGDLMDRLLPPFGGQGLVHPDGTRVELFTDVGGVSDNFIDTTLDDQADYSITTGDAPFTGRYRPERLLSALNGKDAAGVWTLEITDDERRDTGTLDAWTLAPAPQTPPTPTRSIDDVTVSEGDPKNRRRRRDLHAGNGRERDCPHEPRA